MIKLLLIFSIILSPLHAIAEHEPSSKAYNSNGATIRLFKKLTNHTVMFETAAGTGYDSTNSFLLKLGAYYKISDGNKLGYFISSNKGLRHTDDWIKVKSTSKWKWDNSSDRAEEVIHLNYSKRFVPYFDEPIVLDLKGEVQYNLYNQEQSFIFKPGLNYFLLKKGIPTFSFHFSIPLYFGLNFEQNKPYKYGLYLGSLYHYNKSIQIGINIKAQSETWTDSEDTKEFNFDDPYEVTDTITTTALEIIYHF